MSDFGSEISSEFLQDAKDLFGEAEKALLALEQGELLANHYNPVFRAFHSIKGGAGMLGMERLQQIVHHLESLLTKNKNDKTMKPEIVNYLLLGIDSARQVIEGQSENFELIDPLARTSDLPQLEKAPATPPTAQISGPKLGKVFVLDDEPEIRMMTKNFLNHMNFEAFDFSAGDDLLRALNFNEADAFLLDYQMPKMSGIAVLKEIRKRNPDVPVIFVSGHLSLSNCIEGLNLGAYAFIEKPFSPENLLASVRNAITAYGAFKTINQCINLLMYQFPDIDKILEQNGKETARNHLRLEMQKIIDQRKILRECKVMQHSQTFDSVFNKKAALK